MAIMSLRDEVAELLQELVRLDTVNPPGNETVAASTNVPCSPERTAICREIKGLSELYLLVDDYYVEAQSLPQFGITHWKLNPRYRRANGAKQPSLPPKEDRARKPYTFTPEGRAKRVAAMKEHWRKRKSGET